MTLPSDVHLIKNYLHKDVVSLLLSEIRLFTNASNVFGDTSGYVDNTFNWYSPPGCEALMVNMKEFVEKTIGLNLHPTYSYARIYKNGSELKKHLDRRSSEHVVTCCLYKELPYPITIDDGKKLHHIDLDVGDVLIFPGRKYFHWRDKYQGEEHIHCFLQYVNANGELAEFKYDTRPCLGSNYQFTEQKVKDEMIGGY
jgi:hypothetical protein